MRLRNLLLLSAVIALSASGQISVTGGSAGIPSGPLVKLSGSVSSLQGDEVHGKLTAIIENGWHINSNKPLTEFSIPTVLTLEPATAELVKAGYPQHTVRTFSFSAGEKIAVYEGTIEIPFVAKLKNHATSIKASLKYQACNDSVCLPPRTVEAEVATAVSATGASAPSFSTATPSANSGFTTLAQAPKAKPSLFSTNISETFAAYGLGLTLVGLFVLGLGLNLTPCVYPVIPITIGYFTQQSDGRRGYRVALSAVYVAGLVATYAVLGAFSALSGRLFGGSLQRPSVLIFFAALMLVLASSMFGLWEIRVPHFISDRSGGRAGLGGALIMGLLVGVVAAPCVGPFVASLITLVAKLQSVRLGLLMFSVLGLGLGTPYLVLGSFSSAAASMPRAGAWMEQVKKAMGFVLIAMAFYFLRSLTGDTTFRYGVALSLFVGALYLFINRSGGARALRLTFATLLLVAAIFWAILPKGEGGKMTWETYLPESIAAASAAHKPVIIDFYATWCLPCKELDSKTFSDDAVAKELDRFVRIKADLTNDRDPLVQKLTKDYSIVGVPTVILIDSSGKEVALERLTGFEEAKPFLERMQRVR